MLQLKTIMAMLVFIPSILTGFKGKEVSKIITPQEFYNQVYNDSNVQLLDVRTQNEYDIAHIKNASLIDVKNEDNFKNAIKVLNKKQPVYVYCRSGVRSHRAAEILNKEGFKVFELEGGILNWIEEALPTENLPAGNNDITNNP